MPKIPSAVPVASGRGLSGAALSTPNFGPAPTFGAQALGEGLDEVAKLAREINDAADESEANLGLARAVEKLDALTDRSREDPLELDETDFGDQAREIVDLEVDFIKNPKLKAALREAGDTAIQKARITFLGARRERQIAQARSNVTVMTQKMSASISKEDDADYRDKMRRMRDAMIMQAREKGVLSADDVKNLNAAANLEEANSMIIRLQRENPVLGKVMLEQEVEPFDKIDESDRQTAITKMEDEILDRERRVVADNRAKVKADNELRDLNRDNANSELLQMQNPTTQDVDARRQFLEPSDVDGWYKRIGDAKPIAVDHDYHSKMRTMAAQEPIKFALDTKLDALKLGEKEHKALLALQRQIKKDGKLDGGTQTRLKRIEDKIESLGLDKDAARSSLFYSRVDDEVEEFARRNQEFPNREQFNTILTGLGLSNFSPIRPGWLTTEGYVFEHEGKIDIGGVPAEFVELVTESLEDEPGQINLTEETLAQRLQEIEREFATAAKKKGASPLLTTERLQRYLNLKRAERDK